MQHHADWYMQHRHYSPPDQASNRAVTSADPAEGSLANTGAWLLGPPRGVVAPLRKDSARDSGGRGGLPAMLLLLIQLTRSFTRFLVLLVWCRAGTSVAAAAQVEAWLRLKRRPKG